MIESHDEKHILNGCIALMDHLVGVFEEYLDIVGFKPDPNDEEAWFHYEINYFTIVQRLFLWGTSHSGGTSTMAKCDELGVDSSKHVVFEIKREESNDGNI